MARSARTAWGIDVGNCTLKAMKLGVGSDGVELLDFAVMEHEKLLSQPDVTPEQRNQLIIDALNKFLEQHSIEDCPVVVAVPGQSSFARFIKLPPVETKRIPEIVRFEAIQQIPFDIEDVEWDYQIFDAEDNPDIEVGIFAIKRDLVRGALEPFTQSNCPVQTVQMAPMALYNCLRHDLKRLQDPSRSEAVITLDIGAENTDLVIADGQRVWQRSIPIGGSHFTQAVQKAFKLGFSKAEAIKRSANTSKHARQIFQAMRSVFAELAGEIQRSLGFYGSSHREVQFREVLALGNAMKLPGLVKFLQQSLSLPVKRLNSFESLKTTPDVSAAQFAENLPSMAVAFGLALQELGLGAIKSNLLPREVARQSLWKRKRRWFLAASLVVLASSLVYLFQGFSQAADISEASKGVATIEQIDRDVTSRTRTKTKYVNDIKSALGKIKKRFEPYQTRDLIPLLLRTIRTCAPNEESVTDQQHAAMLRAYRNSDRESVIAVARELREQIFISRIEIIYTEDLNQNFDAVLRGWAQRQKAAVKEDEAVPGAGWGGMMGPGMMGPGMMGPGMMGPGMMGPGMTPGANRGGKTSRRTAKTKGDEVAGFVILIEGSTPHQDNEQFLFPPMVGIDRSQWGFFHQLQHLGKTDKTIITEKKKRAESEAANKDDKDNKRKKKDKKSVTKPGSVQLAQAWLDVPQTEFQNQANQLAAALPFETFIDPEVEEVMEFFETQGDWIGGIYRDKQPQGLGIFKPGQPRNVRASATRDRNRPGGQDNLAEISGLIDPLTYEPISLTYKLDESGQPVIEGNRPVVQNNDYWFRVKFKVKLKKGKSGS